jgi:hypothetical protein
MTVVSVNATVLKSAPEVPVTVTVAVPAAAVLPAAKVTVRVPLVPAALKDAVTPVGNPEAARLTVPVKPLAGTTAITLLPGVPGLAVTLAGVAVRIKLGAVTTRLTVVEAFRAPDVPAMVIVDVPATAVGPAVNVTVLLLVVLVGLNDAVTPVGSPVAARLTLAVNPFAGTTAITLLPGVPDLAVTPAGVAVRVKPGRATTRLTVVEAVRVPDVPAMVTVAVPAAAVLPAVNVTVLVLVVLVMLGGLKDAVTPVGSPVAARLTLPVKPV